MANDLEELVHLTNLGSNAVLLLVMLGAFAWIDRYAARHPYGTGHFGEMERKRRASEAHRRRIEQQNRQGRERNEATMADMRARLRPEAGARTTSSADAEANPGGAGAGGSSRADGDPAVR